MHQLLSPFSDFRVYFQRRMIALFFLGMASGLPLPLVLGTLDIWLTEEGISKTVIGLFAFVSTPYTLKFLWAPFIDRIQIPWLSTRIGHRRSWLLVTQTLLMASLVLLGSSSPATNITLTALFTLLVSFCSASYDIVVDAYRIEVTKEEEQGAGAASLVYGYTFSMKIIGGSIALILADHIPWSAVYMAMSALLLMGTFAIWSIGEPIVKREISQHGSLRAYMLDMVWTPFQRFMTKNGWAWLLLLIVLFKFGDTFAGKMTGPFLIDLGFTKTEYGLIVKTYGLIPSLIGTAIGGVIVYRMGMIKSLWITGILQMLSNLFFVWQAHVGHDPNVLAIVIGVENFSSGLGTAALVAFISSLCDRNFTATHYALLSSFASMGRTWLSGASGYFYESLGAESFFILSTFLAAPALILLIFAHKYITAQKAISE